MTSKIELEEKAGSLGIDTTDKTKKELILAIYDIIGDGSLPEARSITTDDVLRNGDFDSKESASEDTSMDKVEKRSKARKAVGVHYPRRIGENVKQVNKTSLTTG